LSRVFRNKIPIYKSQDLAPDCRIDICFFFCPPHRFKGVDKKFFQYISPLVLVVPLMAKADSMTQRERISYRFALLSVLRNVPSYNIEEVLSIFAGIPANRFPYSVIGAEYDVDGKELRQQRDGKRIRMYPWGNAEVDNSDHCDISLLRQSLLQSNDFHSLKLLTSQRWERFTEADEVVWRTCTFLLRSLCFCC